MPNSNSVHAARRHDSSMSPTRPVVLISAAVFEEPRWVDTLLLNVRHFTEPSTRVMLHLNALTQYADVDVQRWNGSAAHVGVATQRVAVSWSTGSLLYAHMLSIAEAARRWPICEYVVLQASNMLWVRAGMELRVRSLRSSVTSARPLAPPMLYARTHPFYKSLLGSRKRDSWNYHEGSFYPISTPLRFLPFMEDWFQHRSTSNGTCLPALFPSKEMKTTCSAANVTGDRAMAVRFIMRAIRFPEEMWLSAFALNVEGLPPAKQRPSQLCFRDATLGSVMSASRQLKLQNPHNLLVSTPYTTRAQAQTASTSSCPT